MKSYLVILSALLGLAAAQKKDSEAMCVPAIKGPHSPFRMVNTEKLPGCLQLFYSDKVRAGLSKCYDESDEMKSMDAIAKVQCTLREFDIIVDGAIDFVRMRDIITESSGPQEQKDIAMNALDTCITDSEEAIQDQDAATQYLIVSGCMSKAISQYCIDNNQDPGMLPMLVGWQHINTNTCIALDLKSRVVPIMQCMLMKMKMKMPNSSLLERAKIVMERAKTNDVVRLMLETGVMKMMGEFTSCIGMVNEETGDMSFENMEVLIGEIRGWETIPEHKELVMAAIRECGTYAINLYNSLSPAELLRRTAWVPKVPKAGLQMHMFKQCFMPRFAETCGMKNQLGVMLNHEIMSQYDEQSRNEICGESREAFMARMMQFVKQLDDFFEEMGSMDDSSMGPFPPMKNTRERERGLRSRN